MEQITARVPEEMAEQIEAEADDTEQSQSEVVRNRLRLGYEYGELETELERQRNENEGLRNQLATLTNHFQEHNELVKYVEDERTLEQQRRQAGILTRTKWWLTGMPSDDENE